jgi:outer membrane receptor protein involved in Fe transport
LRGSYSESFKAPDLAFLFSSGTTSFTSFQVIDPVTGTEIDQLQIQGGGNPDLAAEETDTWYAGLVIEPNSGPLDGFRLGVDYFKFESTNLIAQLSDFFGFTEFLRGAAEGDPLFADKVVRDPITDEVLFIRDTFENLSERTYEGYDFTLAYENEYAWGNFRAQLLSTYLESLTLDEDEFAGDYLNPEWRHNLTLAWQKGDWSASIYTTYIGERDRSLFFFTPVEGNDVFLTYTIDSQIVVNPQVSYDGLWDTRITVGVNNVFDENPPEDLFQAAGFTPGVNIGTPAFWYFRIGRDF